MKHSDTDVDRMARDLALQLGQLVDDVENLKVLVPLVDDVENLKMLVRALSRPLRPAPVIPDLARDLFKAAYAACCAASQAMPDELMCRQMAKSAWSAAATFLDEDDRCD